MAIPPTNSRFAPYRSALNAISLRTGTPLPSLLVSFAVLHELTAIVPLVGIFYGARALGVGERIINAVIQEGSSNSGASGWAREKCRSWVEEGERWARRVGNRYGIFGLQKAQNTDGPRETREGDETRVRYESGQIAGDVANAVVAYAATKARYRALLDSLSTPANEVFPYLPSRYN